MKIATVQICAELGEEEVNLGMAESLAGQAFRAGAEWVILPEFFNSAIGFHEKMFQVPRPFDSAPLALLRRLAARHHGVVGGSFLVLRGARVVNTFVLLFPDGAMFLHDKDQPSFYENCYYVAGSDDGVFQTPTCRVGLAMCAEYTRARTARRMLGRVDLVVGGTCWPTLPFDRFFPATRAHHARLAAEAPARLARLLGVPVVQASHAGALNQGVPLLPGLIHRGTFLGETQIVDGEGNVLCRMTREDGEGFLCAEVDLTRKCQPKDPIPDSFWVIDYLLVHRFGWWYQNLHGRSYYRRVTRRRYRALYPEFREGKRRQGEPGQVSATARYIAQGMLLFSRTPRYKALVPEPDAQLSRRVLEASGHLGSAFIHYLGSRLFRRILLWITGGVTPGLFMHLALRKKIIECHVGRAIADGFTSVIVLAAGFDGLANRLHRQCGDVLFVEIDLPGTIRMKERCLAGCGGNLRFIPADLASQRPLQVLGELPPEALRKIIVVAEGLLMYLDEVEVRRLLTAIASLSSEDLRLVFTFVEPTPDGRIALRTSTRLGALWLAWRKSPFRWGIARGELPAFLEPLGYRVEAIRDSGELAAEQGLPDELVAQGEPTCIAHRATPPLQVVETAARSR